MPSEGLIRSVEAEQTTGASNRYSRGAAQNSSDDEQDVTEAVIGGVLTGLIRGLNPRPIADPAGDGSDPSSPDDSDDEGGYLTDSSADIMTTKGKPPSEIRSSQLKKMK